MICGGRDNITDARSLWETGVAEAEVSMGVVSVIGGEVAVAWAEYSLRKELVVHDGHVDEDSLHTGCIG